MPRKQTVEVLPSLQQALEVKTVDELKKLCSLLSLDQTLTRKADLVTAILRSFAIFADEDNGQLMWNGF